MSDRKASITNASMSEGMQQNAVDRARDALNANRIKDFHLMQVQRKLFSSDDSADEEIMDEPEPEDMEWQDITILERNLPQMYRGAQFTIRQASRDSSDTEASSNTLNLKPKSKQSTPQHQVTSNLLDVDPKITIPSTSPIKRAVDIVIHSPFPSDPAPPNYVYVYFDMEKTKFYVLTTDGMQLHHKYTQKAIRCAAREKLNCKAILHARAIVAGDSWNLFKFKDGKNHTCHTLCENFDQWVGSKNIVKPAELKVDNPNDSLDDLFENLRL